MLFRITTSIVMGQSSSSLVDYIQFSRVLRPRHDGLQKLHHIIVSVRRLNDRLLPSPFFGPLMPSSAALSDGWRLRNTSSFSLNRIFSSLTAVSSHRIAFQDFKQPFSSLITSESDQILLIRAVSHTDCSSVSAASNVSDTKHTHTPKQAGGTEHMQPTEGADLPLKNCLHTNI